MNFKQLFANIESYQHDMKQPQIYKIKLKKNRKAIDFDEMAGGLNKRKMIQSAVFKELVDVSECNE